MEITEQDAFKLGFLARCAEEKLTGQSLEARLEKVAQFNKAAIAEYLPKMLTGPASDIGLAYLGALSLPFAASMLGGGAVGYGIGSAVEPRVNEDEIRAKELADTYRLYADKAKNRRKAVKYRAQREHSEQPQQSFDDVYARV